MQSKLASRWPLRSVAVLLALVGVPVAAEATAVVGTVAVATHQALVQAVAEVVFPARHHHDQRQSLHQRQHHGQPTRPNNPPQRPKREQLQQPRRQHNAA
jgi:hypothetical protein